MSWIEKEMENPVLLVAAKKCSDCDTIKRLCLKSGFAESEICFQEVGEEKLKEAQQLSGLKVCPIVWVRGQVLGGVKETQQAWFDGTLPRAKYELILQEAAKEMVAHSATTNTLVVLSKKTCPPCTEVKIMLEEAGFTKEQTNIITISDWPTMDHIQEHCRQLTGERWTPRVWIGGKAMGGIKEIKPMFEDESLHELAESFQGKSGPIPK